MEDASRNYQPLYCKKFISISQSPLFVDYNVKQSIDKEIKDLFFLPAGKFSAKAEIEKDCFQPNEIIKIDMDVNNSNCEERIRKFEISLYREIIAYNQNGS